ncbi:MAG: hydroxyacylglutathione hydrolase family protein, partial [Thermoproteota archaeon]
MKVHQIQVGNMQNFTYVVEDEDTNEGIIIDPSWDLDQIEQVIKRNNLKIKYIINTHHHFDHTLGNEGMIKSTNAKIIQHEKSELKHDITVKDGDIIEFGNSKLTVLHTPGHSKDSMCLIGDGKIFSGDALFVGNCGRVDLPGGSAK